MACKYILKENKKMAQFVYPIDDVTEIPYWLIFHHAPYSVLAEERTRDAIVSRSEGYIQLPLPQELLIKTDHEYNAMVGTVGGEQLSKANELNTVGGRPALYKKFLVDRALYSLEQASTTSTYRRFGNTNEMTLVNEARRVITLEYILIPRSSFESRTITDMCNYFRTFSYPAATSTPERTFPPDLWRIAVAGEGETEFLSASWLSDPLVCVLRSVHINKSPIPQDVPRFFEDGGPMATAITLVFQEHETGTQKGGKVFSKSELAAQALAGAAQQPGSGGGGGGGGQGN